MANACSSHNKEHPLVSFQREVLLTYCWAVVRGDFHRDFVSQFHSTSNTPHHQHRHYQNHQYQRPSPSFSFHDIISEKRKFDRHCREALGKWILAQKARLLSVSDDTPGFLPPLTGAFSSLMPPTVTATSTTTERGTDAVPGVTFPSTFDDQLIRDLTLKCRPDICNDKGLHDAVRDFVQTEFQLTRRCQKAKEAVDAYIKQELLATSSSHPLGQFFLPLPSSSLSSKETSQPTDDGTGVAGQKRSRSDDDKSRDESKSRVSSATGGALRINLYEDAGEFEILISDPVETLEDGTKRPTVTPSSSPPFLYLPQHREVGTNCDTDGNSSHHTEALRRIDGIVIELNVLVYRNQHASGNAFDSSTRSPFAHIPPAVALAAGSTSQQQRSHNYQHHRQQQRPQPGVRAAASFNCYQTPFGPGVPVSVPLAVWIKLHFEYCHATSSSMSSGESKQDTEYQSVPIMSSAPGSSSNTGLDALTFRAATILLRYEANLASGSLQLCADTSLKEELSGRSSINASSSSSSSNTSLQNNTRDSSFTVIDLCASPINAYQPVGDVVVRQAVGQLCHNSSANTPITTRLSQHCLSLYPTTTSALTKVHPYCSAFFDSDQYFGSLGSATILDIDDLIRQERARDSIRDNRDSKRFCLTLDVPYDEDLCNLLFVKLAQDCRTLKTAPYCTFLLVLPLWWDLNFRKVHKKVFGNDGDTEEAAVQRMQDQVKRGVGYLAHGFPVAYPWPVILQAGQEEERSPQSYPTSPPAVNATTNAADWCCFDAVFVKSAYSYFSAIENRTVTGVTATQVLGFEQPYRLTGNRDEAGAASSFATLGSLLSDYYSRTT